MANRNYASAGKLYTGHVKPVLIDCNFIVDSTNGNGLGIRSLKGPYVQNVFMNTSAGSVTTTSVFASGATVLTLASVGGLYVGMAVADSTTGGNITSGTLITSINVGRHLFRLVKQLQDLVLVRLEIHSHSHGQETAEVKVTLVHILQILQFITQIQQQVLS